MPSKLVTVLKPGDRLLVETAGGGGYGPAGERERDLVDADIANGKVSAEEAARLYGTAAE